MSEACIAHGKQQTVVMAYDFFGYWFTPWTWTSISGI